VEVAKEEREEAMVQPVLEPAKLFVRCQSEAKKNLASANNDAEKEAKIIEEFNACLKHGLTPTLIQADNEIKFERILREKAAMRMENFTCADPDNESSPDVDQLHWTSEKDGVNRLVHVKLDRLASRIHVVENFVSPEECAAMEENASERLQSALTADGKGGSEISLNRKAMQAGIVPDFSKEADGDLIARLSRRVYDYTNHVLDLAITEHGQEPLMSIQYFGRGYNDTEPDRYTPHCDGTCDGTRHDRGARMATMVMYCTIPEKGGHTNFQNADVHVKPEVGSGLFFSYIDPATNGTDFGFTQHSGCPVYEGEKKIITQWVRYGVDAQTSRGSFNTCKFVGRSTKMSMLRFSYLSFVCRSTVGILKSEDGE
jgi:hypothetical protein